MGTFHSAVNRIPVPRQSVHNLVAEGMLPKDIFGDHAAPGHDRLANEGWSGTIDLEMTVSETNIRKTPKAAKWRNPTA